MNDGPSGKMLEATFWDFLDPGNNYDKYSRDS